MSNDESCVLFKIYLQDDKNEEKYPWKTVGQGMPYTNGSLEEKYHECLVK